MGKSTDTLIGIGGALLLAFAVVMALNNGSSSDSTNNSNSTDSSVSAPVTTAPTTTKAPKPVATPSTTKAQTTAPTTTKAPATTPATTSGPLEWAEDAISRTMYVNQSCYSRTRAIMGSDTVRAYSYGDTVHVTAITDTGYYKLDNGEYIHGDYLSES